MATPKRSAAKKSTKVSKSQSAKAGLIFPVGRIGRMLRKGQYAKRVGASAGVYAAAVLEYLTAELLELTTKAVVEKKAKRLTPRAMTLAVRADDDLGELLKSVTLSRGGVVPSVDKASKKAGKKAAKKAKKSKKQ